METHRQTIGTLHPAGWDMGLHDDGASWENLPHAVPGGRPASACRKIKVKAAVRRPRRERPRRHNPELAFGELSAALAGHAPRNQAELTPVPLVRRGSPSERRRQRAATKRAAVLNDAELARVLDHIHRTSRCPESDRVKVLLSFKAGLRVGEIAGLTVRCVTTASRAVRSYLEVGESLSKNGKSRQVPINPLLAEAIAALLRRYPQATHLSFSHGSGGRLRPQSPATLTNWFSRLYREVGLAGCSSHSGRRTFATTLLRRGMSLHELQRFLGHESLSSTECYLEPTQTAADLIALIGSDHQPGRR